MSGQDDWARGIDVSYANAHMPNLVGRDFVFVRACYGTREDARWASHAAEVRGAGAVLGAYSFGIYGDGREQADAFLAIAGEADLLALDLEKESGKARMTAAQARAFIAEVKSAGREIGLYHSDSSFPALGQDWNWVARWGTTPPDRIWAFWQYRGSPLDLDYFQGDRAALDRFAARGGSEMINATGNDLQSRRIARITTDTPLLDTPGGTRIATAKAGYGYPFVGVAAAHRAVLVETALPYPDGVKRPTVLYVAASAVALEDVSPPTGTSNRATVTLQITGHADYVTEV